MAEEKKRSGIFKFFYVILSIITFPIFAVLFILRHPLWILFILLVLAGGAYYYPIHQEGVKPDEVIAWYQKKYSDVKIEMVNKAIESGTTDYLPKAVLDDVKKIEEEAKEAQMPKGENYNNKIARDAKDEETKVMIKKRGGFKKKNDTKDEAAASEEPSNENLNEVEVLTEGVGGAGGLSSLLKNEDENESEENPKEEVEKISESVEEVVSEPKEEPVLPVAEPEKTAEPEPVTIPEKPVIPMPVEEKEEPASNDDDLELDFF